MLCSGPAMAGRQAARDETTDGAENAGGGWLWRLLGARSRPAGAGCMAMMGTIIPGCWWCLLVVAAADRSPEDHLDSGALHCIAYNTCMHAALQCRGGDSSSLHCSHYNSLHACMHACLISSVMAIDSKQLPCLATHPSIHP